MCSIFDQLKCIANRYSRNVVGNVSLLFAIVIPIVLIAVGASVEVTRMVNTRTKLQNAADAASLAGSVSLIQERKNWKSISEEAFSAQTRDIEFTKDPKVRPYSPENGTVVVDVQASLKPYFGQILGRQDIKIEVSATSKSSQPTYVQATFLIDGSHSMGIGATEADQLKMVASTGCAIACHYGHSTTTLGNFDKAKATGAVMRIDVVREAMQGFITDIDNSISDHETFGLAAYTYGNGIEEIIPATTNYDTALAKVNEMELMRKPLYLGSDMKNSVQALSDVLPASGSGKSKTDRKSIVILVTDGVSVDSQPELTYSSTTDTDYISKWQGNPEFKHPEWSTRLYQIQAVPEDVCYQLTRFGHEVYTINLEYVVPTVGAIEPHDVERFAHIEDKLIPLAKSRLKACSTEYYHGRTASEIQDMFTTLSDDLTEEIELYLSK